MVSYYLDRVGAWFVALTNAIWVGLNNLDPQGWFEALAVAAVCGFFFLRGYGSRKDY